MNPEKISGVCGILGPVLALIFISLSIMYSPWFSFTGNWLSDLGVSGLGSLFFNSGLIIAGLFGVGFSLGFRKKNRSGYIMLVGSVLLMGVGLFPETAGPVHFYLSALFFAVVTLAMLANGIFSKGHERYFSVLLALVSIIAWLPFFDLGVGAIREAISSTTFGLFLIVFGYKMIRK